MYPDDSKMMESETQVQVQKNTFCFPENWGMSTSDSDNKIFKCHNFSKNFKLKAIMPVDEMDVNCADISASEHHA
jgi:hypothetical protein